MKFSQNTIQNLDALAGLKKMAPGTVNCCITSPPYWMLRDYGVPGQLGQEGTPEKYVAAMVKIFKQVYRVLAEDGTLWLNIGDTYATNSGGYKAPGQTTLSTGTSGSVVRKGKVSALKSKDLIGIPWMVAFALRKAGWYLRQDIIWSKPNPMPESVTDRCTKSHEYIFMFSKSPRYYYDHEAIRTELAPSSVKRLAQDLEYQAGSDRVPGKTNGTMKAVGGKQRGHGRRHAGFNDRWDGMSKEEQTAGGANKRSVWKANDAYAVWDWIFNNAPSEIAEQLWQSFLSDSLVKKDVWEIATKPFKEAHFATFPPELIVDCIKAGSRAGDIILDPFMGAGTTALVARKLDRNFIGFEINPEYINIANNRLNKELGLFI